MNRKIVFFAIREEDGVNGVPMHARAILMRREWNVGANSTHVSRPVSFFIAAVVSEMRWARERYSLVRNIFRISSDDRSSN